MNNSLIFITILLFFFLNLQNNINCNQLDDSTYPEKRKMKPSIIPERTYCNACITILLGSIKELNGLKSIIDIEYILSEIFEHTKKLSKFIVK